MDEHNVVEGDEETDDDEEEGTYVILFGGKWPGNFKPKLFDRDSYVTMNLIVEKFEKKPRVMKSKRKRKVMVQKRVQSKAEGGHQFRHQALLHLPQLCHLYIEHLCQPHSPHLHCLHLLRCR